MSFFFVLLQPLLLRLEQPNAWQYTILVYYETQCIVHVIHAIAQSSQVGVVRENVTITHKSLRISWIWLLPALADDAENREFDVSLFECNLGLGVTCRGDHYIKLKGDNYPQDKELDWNRDFGFPLIWMDMNKTNQN